LITVSVGDSDGKRKFFLRSKRLLTINGIVPSALAKFFPYVILPRPEVLFLSASESSKLFSVREELK
jgi:hypothetical protein